MTNGVKASDPKQQLNIAMFLVLVLILAALISLGPVGLFCFVVVYLGVTIAAPSNRIYGGLFAVLIVAMSLAHFAFAWDPQAMVYHPILVWKYAIQAYLRHTAQDVLSHWNVSFRADLIWIALYASLLAMTNIGLLKIYDAYNPVWAERKKAKLAKKKAENSTKKPRRKNADNMPANYQTNTLLGNSADNGELITLSDKDLNTHCLIVGTTGGGKTVSVLNLVESFINRNLPVLYIDGKGSNELGKRICAYAQSKGVASRFFQ